MTPPNLDGKFHPTKGAKLNRGWQNPVVKEFEWTPGREIHQQS